MSEQLKFYKGNESNLPSVFEVGAIYHCLDTGNTYLATSASTLQIFSTNKKIYVQNDEPTDAPEGSLWIDLDAVSEWEAVTSVAGKTGAVTLEPSDVGAAPVSHASSSATYGSANNTNYGHVRLSASTSSTSGVTSGYAATPSAVKSAYDLANGKPDLGSTAPSALGIASAGSATTAAKSDHIHPMQTKTVYATSSTSASTGTKIATTVESIAFSLVQGARVSVKFSNANTTTSLTYLNVTGRLKLIWSYPNVVAIVMLYSAVGIYSPDISQELNKVDVSENTAPFSSLKITL